jgi:hypothetical protein
MKNHLSLLFCLLVTVLVAPACKNDSPTPANSAPMEAPAAAAPATGGPTMPTVNTMPANPADAAAQTMTTPVQEPPQNASGVWHYTCPKGCKKGGGAAGPCATCGATLSHNAAYHGPANATPNPAAAAAAAAAASGTTPPPTPVPEPAQNKAGVWHYTCPDGCAGGAGAASPCAKCKKTLAHNAAYHQ